VVLHPITVGGESALGLDQGRDIDQRVV